MASNKVVLRTAFEGDRFILGFDTKDEVVVTSEGTEFPNRAKADEALAAAERAGVRLFEVPVEVPAKTEGGNG